MKTTSITTLLAAAALLGAAAAAPVGQQTNNTTLSGIPYPLPTLDPDRAQGASVLPVVPIEMETVSFSVIPLAPIFLPHPGVDGRPAADREVTIQPELPVETKSAEVSNQKTKSKTRKPTSTTY